MLYHFLGIFFVKFLTKDMDGSIGQLWQRTHKSTKREEHMWAYMIVEGGGDWYPKVGGPHGWRRFVLVYLVFESL